MKSYYTQTLKKRFQEKASFKVSKILISFCEEFIHVEINLSIKVKNSGLRALSRSLLSTINYSGEKIIEPPPLGVIFSFFSEILKVTLQTCVPKISASVDGLGSSVRRPGSDDPHRC
jgi:hypothetical protein